ncbi:hypothetical protein [Winogradskyella alexanderae]|uniref:Uncharacterized protein n=1 Tax=Winogradskyella alexanderae TaxID=2877123 RepID=A0ABS7XWP0_9FLAO|nr:hypothetical protein [Winogradskyella alexanderae]MCA0133874.1 hypothetical protein [Winogradskyella alexanderae]
MRNIVLLIVGLLSIGFCYAQIKGVDFKKAVEIDTENPLALNRNERRLIKDKEGDFLIYFGSPRSEVGLQRAVERMIEICKANGLDFESPSINRTILKKGEVDSIYDYENLSDSLLFETSEVDQTYEVGKSRIKLFIDRRHILIWFLDI